MVRLVSALLVLAYLFALVMSAGHLSEWYRLTLGSLPSWFAVGLATALEASAFLLSLLSNSILKASRWANWGALVALGLVWVGNYMSMLRAASGIPAYEVFLSSLFVPVSTYVVAKVLGELQTLGVGVNREPRRVSPVNPKVSLEVSREEPLRAPPLPEVSPVNPMKVSPEVSPVNPKVSPGEPRVALARRAKHREVSPEVSSEPKEVSPVNPEVYPVNPKVSSREPQGVPPEVSEVSQVSEVSPLRVNPVVSWKPGPTREASLNGTPKVSPNGYARYLELLDSPKTIAELAQLASVSKPAARKALRFLEAQGLVEAREGRWVRKDAHPVNGELPIERSEA